MTAIACCLQHFDSLCEVTYRCLSRCGSIGQVAAVLEQYTLGAQQACEHLLVLLPSGLFCSVCLRLRFRDAKLDPEKQAWERNGEGIVPLDADTEPVQNINEHR